MDAKEKQSMKPGMYALRKDVVNPKPDRRKKNDWVAVETFKAGERFYLRSYPDSALPRIAPEIVKLGKYGNVSVFSDVGNVLVPALVLTEPTTQEALQIREVWSREVLVRLIEYRIVTLEQVYAVQGTLEEELEKKDGE